MVDIVTSRETSTKSFNQYVFHCHIVRFFFFSLMNENQLALTAFLSGFSWFACLCFLSCCSRFVRDHVFFFSFHCFTVHPILSCISPFFFFSTFKVYFCLFSLKSLFLCSNFSSVSVFCSLSFSPFRSRDCYMQIPIHLTSGMTMSIDSFVQKEHFRSIVSYSGLQYFLV